MLFRSSTMTKIYDTPIKLIIFDNDGTLMDTEWCYSIAHKEVTGYDLDWDFKLQLMGKTAIEACRLTCNHYNLTETPESLANRRNLALERFWPTIPLMPGADSIVKELIKRNIKISIATASNRSNFEQKSSGHIDFVKQFPVIICGDEVKHGKPEPDLFLAALSKFEGIKPEEALVFEDSPLGILAANRAGIPSVFVPDSHIDIDKSLDDQGAKPILTISSFDKFDFNLFNWK